MRLRTSAGSLLLVAVLTAAVTLGVLLGLPLLPWFADAPVDPVPWPKATVERVVPQPRDTTGHRSSTGASSEDTSAVVLDQGETPAQ